MQFRNAGELVTGENWRDGTSACSRVNSRITSVDDDTIMKDTTESTSCGSSHPPGLIGQADADIASGKNTSTPSGTTSTAGISSPSTIRQTAASTTPKPQNPVKITDNLKIVRDKKKLHKTEQTVKLNRKCFINDKIGVSWKKLLENI